ncbi:MAG: ion transporter [Alphaproteobacteria bacterium]|nr:ion transporter [Alphaproteobacteria bacterium]
MQARLRETVASDLFQGVVIALILLNAVVLGAETIDGISNRIGPVLLLIDRVILYLFLVEIIMRFLSDPKNYFRSGWNVFDFVVVAVSLPATASGLAAVRALRVLRVLRVVTVIPRMRVVVAALFDSVPGIASVGVVLVLILYVFAVIAANLYGVEHPELFGDVFAAMYTLFTVMTLEGWREIADSVSCTHPNSWAFFLTFLLIATFTMLNLFVAIVVRVVEEDADEEDAARDADLKAELLSLHEKVDRMLAERRDLPR